MDNKARVVYKIELCRCLRRCRCLHLYASSGDVWVEAAARDPSVCFSVLAWFTSLCFALVPCLGFIALASLPCLPCLVFVHRLALPSFALPSFALVNRLAAPYLTLPLMMPCLALGSGLVFLLGLRLRSGNIFFSYLDGMQ